MNLNFKIKIFKKGFTLIESLVAISILMIAIASPMTLAQKGLSTATLSKDQMVASFLAQDAIEAVKNIRDQIALDSTSANWLTSSILDKCICTDIDNNCNFDAPALKFCNIDTTLSWNNSNSVIAGVLPAIKLKTSYSDIAGVKHFLKYDYNGAEESKFTRYINIKKTPSMLDEAVINVRVFWTSAQGVQKIDVQDFIYNYSQNL